MDSPQTAGPRGDRERGAAGLMAVFFLAAAAAAGYFAYEFKTKLDAKTAEASRSAHEKEQLTAALAKEKTEYASCARERDAERATRTDISSNLKSVSQTLPPSRHT